SYIDTITQNSDKLLAIISDIIDISNIEAGIVKLSEEKILINDVFDKLGKVFVPLAEARDLKLRLVKNLPDVEAVILSDNQKFYQILLNLLNNSFKFTSAGSVEAGYSIKKDFIEFYVSDTGIGIPENQLSRIFDRFYQVDHTISRTFEGTGLGLSISKSFVEYMGGKMWVESRHGNGSVFYFTLPYRKPDVEKPAPAGSEQINSSANCNIIVVEDEEFNARLMLSYLKHPKFNVRRFSNGEDTLNHCLAEKNTDLVIMDLHLPGINGLDVVRKLKKSFPDIRIIAQTAYAIPGDKEEALAAGCDDFITKPFRKEFFISKVMEHLST
ncbi:MAG TPA: ATP-binding protein, partial [Bacteroidales bacterium]|nr:ATP-binding protein [Bacteroidales bacterium]